MAGSTTGFPSGDKATLFLLQSQRILTVWLDSTRASQKWEGLPASEPLTFFFNLAVFGKCHEEIKSV